MFNVKNALNSNLLNKAELVRQMWPDRKYGVQYLNAKIHQRNGKRLTEKDEEQIKQILTKELCITF